MIGSMTIRRSGQVATHRDAVPHTVIRFIFAFDQTHVASTDWWLAIKAG